MTTNAELIAEVREAANSPDMRPYPLWADILRDCADALEAVIERAELAEADNAALIGALERFVKDYEKRGLTGSAKSWAKTVLGMEPFSPKTHPGQPIHDELRSLRLVRDAAKDLYEGVRDQAYGCWCIPGKYKCVTHRGFDLGAALDAAKEAGRSTLVTDGNATD